MDEPELRTQYSDSL